MNNRKNRLLKLFDLMKLKKLDALLISKRENYLYFSGFTGSAAYLLISNKGNFLFTDARYIEQASIETSGFTIIDHANKLAQELFATVKDLGIKSIGMEGGHITHNDFIKYRRHKIGESVVSLTNEIDMLRAVKDDKELEVIENAARIADEALLAVLPLIKPGVSELEVSAELEYNMKKRGAQKTSFDTIIASGIRSALPHGVASGKKIELGDALIIDFGAVAGDYCSDMTRTVFVGRPSDELKKIYGIVKEAQQVAVDRVVRGIGGKEADSIARNIIDGYGYVKWFGHGLGHGVGIEIHEAPTLSPRSESVMENNMVVTVEPGIYIPGLGGVRIEDMIVINDDKPKVLTRSSKEMIVI